MKFMHLSDLHLGKRVNGYSMLEDQKYILIKIINIIDEQKPQAVKLQAMYMTNLSLPQRLYSCLMTFYTNLLKEVCR